MKTAANYTKRIENAPTRTRKVVRLKDGNGNKLARKIRRDARGLYVVNKGARGYLKKHVECVDGGTIRCIFVTRSVAYYVG